MNAERRAKLDQIKEHLEALKDAEQEAYDNLPEGLQESEKGQTLQSNVDAFDTALSELEAVE